MSAFFNPFRAPESRSSRPRRSPRYALESLEARLSPSSIDMGLSTVQVSTMSTSTLGSNSISLSTTTTSTTSTTTSTGLVSSSLIIDDSSLPDGNGEPPYTPPGSGGGPSGPA